MIYVIRNNDGINFKSIIGLSIPRKLTWYQRELVKKAIDTRKEGSYRSLEEGNPKP